MEKMDERNSRKHVLDQQKMLVDSRTIFISAVFSAKLDDLNSTLVFNQQRIPSSFTDSLRMKQLSAGLRRATSIIGMRRTCDDFLY